MNKVIITDNITKDLEIRKTQTGKSVLRFSIANNEGYGDKKVTTFINCQAWENTADLIGRYCAKGSKVLIDGAMKTSSYEKDGRTIVDTYVLVNSVEFLGQQRVDTQNSVQPREKHSNPAAINPDELPFY